MKKLVLEFSEEFDRILILTIPSKNEDESENIDSNIDVMDIVEPTPEPPLISTECDLISMDTDTVSECEVIAKPEEAGGTIINTVYLQKLTFLYFILPFEKCNLFNKLPDFL